MSASQNLEFLTPGSVWIRPRDGRTAKFLFLTNGTLPAAVQLKHPSQVVYADETGNVYNRDVDDFFRIYSFLNVDGDLEKRIETLLRFDAASLANIQDEDTPEPEPAPTPAPVVETKPRIEVKSKADVIAKVAPKNLADHLYSELTDKAQSPMRVRFAISNKEGYAAPHLTSADLEKALVVYAEQPDDTYDMTVHKLVFKLSNVVTFETLREVFHPSNEVNTVDAFQVATRYGMEETVWDSWIGVYPEFSVHGLYAVVHVGSSVSPIDTQETPGIDAIPVKHESINHESTQVPDLTDIHSLIAPVVAVVSHVEHVHAEQTEVANTAPAVEILEAVVQPLSQIIEEQPSTPPPVVTVAVNPQVAIVPPVQAAQPAPVIEVTATPAPVPQPVTPPVTPLAAAVTVVATPATPAQ